MTKKVYVILHNYQIPHEPTSDSCNVGVCDSLMEVEKAIRKYMERAELYKDIKISNYVIEEFDINGGESTHAIWLYGDQMKKFVEGVALEDAIK